MDPYLSASLESDPRFPTGPWTGFFQQKAIPGKHQTDLELRFADGELEGEGRDWVGAYTVRGTYDRATGRCEWWKKYRGKHSVAYTGFNQGRGIWGVWEINALAGLIRDKGVFHLWPEGMDVGDEGDRTYAAARAALGLPEEEPAPVVKPAAAGIAGLAAVFLLLCVKMLPLLVGLFR
jgi:hypothetical protein